MKILHINSSDFGGAGIAALRLHKAMLLQGIDSCFMSLDNKINDGINYIRFDTKKETLVNPEQPILSLKNYFLEKLTKSHSKKMALYNKKLVEQKEKFDIIYNNKNFEIFSTPYSNYDLTESEAYKKADIIHLHWVAGYLDYPSFFEKNKKPIVWTIHDENPFRGGFHYKEDEIRNQVDFGELDKKFYQIKLDSIAKQKDLTIVSPSKWLAEEAINSEMFKNKRVFSIKNTLDLTIFKPYDKTFARQFWNIPDDVNVFMFVAQDIDNKRKGFDLLLPIIKNNKLENTYYLIVGNTSELIVKQKNLIFTGSISNEKLMALTYSAADFFILPSKEDNLPNTMLESIACGTPVISFPIGDTKQLLEDTGCGILANEITTNALENTLIKSLQVKNKFSKNKISNFANENFEFVKQTKKYLEIYLDTKFKNI